jgi:hypothetical protein
MQIYRIEDKAGLSRRSSRDFAVRALTKLRALIDNDANKLPLKCAARGGL